MTKYLSMDGVDDYIETPSITFSRIVIDFMPVFKLSTSQAIQGSKSYSTLLIRRQTDNTDNYGSLWNKGVLVNGTIVTNNTTFLPNNTRCTLDSNSSYTMTSLLELFTSSGYVQYTQANVYDIKIYNGANLVAHYDMSTGTALDQSGNGNDATLYGGTWLDDGQGGTTGTPFTYTYDTKQIIYSNQSINLDTEQSIYKNVNLNADTKQSIYDNRLANYNTKQIQYKPIQTTYDSKQVIYKAIQELFDTEQIINEGFTKVTYNYDVSIEQYKPIQESIDTKQTIYKDIELNLDTKQITYKAIQTLYDTLIQLRNEHDETLYATLTIQRVIEHHLRINKGHEDTLKIQRTLEHILRI